MKITKYPQSCLFIETKDKRILVDPGTLLFEERFLKIWKTADIVLITHKHGDHIHKDVLKTFTQPIYATQEVQNTYPEIKFSIIQEKDILSLGDTITIEVVKALHGYNPNLSEENIVKENVGFILSNRVKRLYITSDTICFPNSYKADVVFLPVTAHGLTMSSYEAALFAKKLGASFVFPIHMDNPMYPPNIPYLQEMFAKFDVPYKLLAIEESIFV